MSRVENFLTESEEQEIVHAIIEAEKSTSGEIRVHIESHTKIDHFERAKQVFHMLKMDNTKDENGVLLYVAVHDRKFVIFGDKGIDKIVDDNFWNNTRDRIQAEFLKGQFKDGIIAGIQSAGKEMQQYFPWEPGDQNELSDEVSKA